MKAQTPLFVALVNQHWSAARTLLVKGRETSVVLSLLFLLCRSELFQDSAVKDNFYTHWNLFEKHTLKQFHLTFYNLLFFGYEKNLTKKNFIWIFSQFNLPS